MTPLSNIVICESRAVSTTFFESFRHHLMELIVICDESFMETNNFAADFLRLLIDKTLDSNVTAF